MKEGVGSVIGTAVLPLKSQQWIKPILSTSKRHHWTKRTRRHGQDLKGYVKLVHDVPTYLHTIRMNRCGNGNHYVKFSWLSSSVLKEGAVGHPVSALIAKGKGWCMSAKTVMGVR